MRKILFPILILAIVLGMSNCKVDTDNPPSPKKYRVIYNGNGNTEGEVPVDNNLYAEGDVLTPIQWNYKMKKNGWQFQGWELIGKVKQVKRPLKILSNGNYMCEYITEITFDKNDIELRGLYANSPQLTPIGK